MSRKLLNLERFCTNLTDLLHCDAHKVRLIRKPPNSRKLSLFFASLHSQLPRRYAAEDQSYLFGYRVLFRGVI